MFVMEAWGNESAEHDPVTVRNDEWNDGDGPAERKEPSPSFKDTGKWDAYAYDIPAVFGNTEDCASTVKDFLQYCNTQNINELTILEQKEII